MNPFIIHAATITRKVQDSEDIYTYSLRFNDASHRESFRFSGGQFNMLYVFGVGEVPISIVSDPDEPQQLDHTIRVVGRVTRAISLLESGDSMGIRGPYGRGWPLEEAQGKDILVVTGGLGCAPVRGAIEYVLRRRDSYGALKILHGVKTPSDLLYRDRFDAWRHQPGTEVYLSSDQPGKTWRYHVGVVTQLFEEIEFDSGRTLVLMCGPEVMMHFGIPILRKRGIPDTAIYLSLERHMECGIGLCGHCQMQPFFVCKEGAVMRYDLIAPFLGKAGV